jgi:membrane protease YdiL (CAAX protease family)
MDPSTFQLERKIGVSTLLLFLLSWGVFLIGINVLVLVAWWFGVLGMVIPTPESLVALTSMPVPSWVLLGAAALQFAGMFTLTLLGVSLVGRVRRSALKEMRSRRALFSEQLGLNRAQALGWTAAIAGGLSVGWLPGWIAHWIRVHLPWMDLGAVSSVASSVTSGNQASQWAMIFLVAVAAPIVEELLFRGWIWSAFSRWLPPWGVILVTSVLFGAFHLDPAQGIPLILTGVFLGWVRMTTGSVGPCIAAHLANNGLAIYLAQQGAMAPSSAHLWITVVVTLTMFHTLIRTAHASRTRVAYT